MDLHRGRFIAAGMLAGLLLGLLVAPAIARPTWIEAVVTKSPWMDRHVRIQIDGMPYTFMPKALIVRRYQASEGQYDEQQGSLDDLHQGLRVQAKVEGFRIYKIIVLE